MSAVSCRKCGATKEELNDCPNGCDSQERIQRSSDGMNFKLDKIIVLLEKLVKQKPKSKKK